MEWKGGKQYEKERKKSIITSMEEKNTKWRKINRNIKVYLTDVIK